MHDGDASLEYIPDSQLEHVLSEVAPVLELAFPASQTRQVAEEVAERMELYFPVPQAV